MQTSIPYAPRLATMAVVLSIAFGDTSSAQQTTLRWFAIDQAADLQNESGRRLVARNESGPGDPIVEQFGSFGGGGSYYRGDFILRDSEGNLILDLSNTKWTRLPVLHITEEGVEQYSETYWLWEDLIDTPSPGMTTSTGHEGEALQYVTFGIRRIPSGNGDNSGKLYIASNSPWKLTLYLAPFNK